MAKRFRGPMTAAEFNAALAADPEYQARKAAIDAEHRAETERLAKAEAPLVDALRGTGFGVSSIWDLVNSRERYTDALPVLLDHLQRDYPPKVREGIARAMAVPESKFAWRTLVSLFRQDFDPTPYGAKLGIALALSAAADDEVMMDLIALFRDPRHGANRVPFIKALSRSRLLNARQALEEGRQDPVLATEISAVLDRRARGKKRRSTRSPAD